VKDAFTEVGMLYNRDTDLRMGPSERI